MKNINETALKETISSIAKLSRDELYEIETREELLSKYFYFDFDKKYTSGAERLRRFTDNIELLKHFAERWEKHKHGFTCCVDRVYQYYVNPLCVRYDQTNTLIKDAKLEVLKDLEVLANRHCYPHNISIWDLGNMYNKINNEK